MATKPVNSTCTCEANFAQLRMDWNTEMNPDLIDIERRLNKIGIDHLGHDPRFLESFQTQFTALTDRLIVEQAGSPDYQAKLVPQSRGATTRTPVASPSPAPSPQVSVVRNHLASPAPKPEFKRQDTHMVPDPTPSRSHSQPRSGSRSNSGFRITAKTPTQSPPKPSSDSSKKSEKDE